MLVVTRDEYVKAIDDIERAYLLEIQRNTVYLRANMRVANNRYWYLPRVEQLHAALGRGILLRAQARKARDLYTENITLSEFFGDEERAKADVIRHFLGLSGNALYAFCAEDELEVIRHAFTNESVYVYVKED